MRALFTIGYERAEISDFVATLKLAGVDVLLDVRELPISRRKGFSKSALGDALTGMGIAYRHEKALGSPKEMRHQLREDGDFERFFSAYEQHLADQEALLDELIDDLDGAVALMCFERDHLTCHRKSVARALAERTGLKPRHIGVQNHGQRQKLQGQDSYSGQSLSPA